jgi:hypothetical protein
MPFPPGALNYPAMLPELSAQLPAIISEAAKSPLGIFALMIISLAILGFIDVPPRSVRETFTFEMLAGMLAVTPTFGGATRAAFNVRTGDGTVHFDIRRQAVSGEVTTDIVTSYFGVVHPDRIHFTLRHDNGAPAITFEARRRDNARAEEP